MQEVFDLLARGGVLMIPIGMGSVVALAIFLERMWSLQRSRIVPSALVDDVVKLASAGKLKEARDECMKSASPMGRVLQVGIDVAGLERDRLKEVFEETGKQEIARMERFVEAMGTTASVEPLLGLLGTVVGMIGVFQKVVVTSRSGAVDPSQLANGIWQALVTTAAGLSVAIVAFVGYRYLLSKSGRRALEMEEGAMALADVIAPIKVDKGGSKGGDSK